MSDRVVAIIQARTSSTRLPGKVLQVLAGMPMIAFMAQRVRRSTLVDEIVLATSTDRSDDALAATAQDIGLRCHRGDLDDVLARFAGAAAVCDAGMVVRLTGDCPLIDPDLIDTVVLRLLERGLDYVSNIDPATYPDGLDVEAFTIAALQAAHEQARLPSDREHVTPYIRRHADRFRQDVVRSAVDLSSLRWTVDHPDDLELVRCLVASMTPAQALAADRFDFLRVFDARSMGDAHPRHARNEGYAKSLAQDEARP